MKAVFNISFTAPTVPSCYVGNRRAEYMAQRNFYNLTSEYNFFSYVLNGKKVVKNADAEHYFTREGSNSGLFDMDGAINDEKKKELKAQLKDTKSIIWHGFISFDEETSKGFCSQENCVKFMRQTFGGFLEQAGFKKSNIQLYCALHEDTDHRHIHFAFFEKKPIRIVNGEASYTRRGKISAAAIDNYLVSANMHLSEHAAEYYTARDKALDELKNIREIRSRSQFTNSNRSSEFLLNCELDALAAKLPHSGRLQYNSKQIAPFRGEIDRVAELLINSSASARSAHEEMLKQLARIENEVRGLAEDGKIGYIGGSRMTHADIAAAMDDGLLKNKAMSVEYVDMSKVDYFKRLQADYKARVGNVVLGICKDIRRRGDYSGRRSLSVNDKHAKISAKHRRIYRKNLIFTAQRAVCALARQDSANFLKTVQEHERDIENEARERNA